MERIVECTNEEERNIIGYSLNDFNFSKVPATLSPTYSRFDFVLKNEQDDVLGGILASLGPWGGLEIKILWVKESSRNKGAGTRLLKRIEEEAIQKGAKIAVLDTFDFQAKDFYLKNGYAIFGELDNFPEGHKRYYLSKKLIS